MTVPHYRRFGLVAVVVYAGLIVAANWAIKRYGFVPVGFGLVASLPEPTSAGRRVRGP